jgi:tRNA threonylcarbamoyladenosine biosynthesis protein TsaB
MIVLGFDTSTAATAVALRLSDGSTAEARDDPPPGRHPGHATRLLEMAGELIEAAGIGWSEIDRVAVGVGPGTFTGLRVGVASARGLAQSLQSELVGVSSLKALASAALAHQGTTGTDQAADGEQPAGGVLAVIDARRGEAFAAAYERAGEHGALELTVAQALAPERLGDALPRSLGGIRSEPQAWLAVGDGALRFASHLELVGVRIADEASALHRVSAAMICELGEGAAPVASYEEILPDYRRRPDAELALLRAGEAQGAGA